MNRTGKTVTILAVILAVGLGILYARGLLSVHQGMEPPASLAALRLQKPAKAAPDVAFTDAGGHRIALSSLKGRYVLLNLWATWCAPCVAELPQLSRLAAFAPGIKVVAVNTDRGEVDAAGFLKDHSADALGVYRDTDHVMMRNFVTPTLPVTVLIDPTGKVVARADGPADWDNPEAVAYFKRITGS
jgi:thiol-disulfide isomerase/thioredoxin